MQQHLNLAKYAIVHHTCIFRDLLSLALFLCDLVCFPLSSQLKVVKVAGEAMRVQHVWILSG